MNLIGLDFREEGPVGTPESIKAQYRVIVPKVIEGSTASLTPQQALDHIKVIEQQQGVKLYGVYLGEGATAPQRTVFNRKLFRLKDQLHIILGDEALSLAEIEADFLTTATRLSGLRGMRVEEADSLLMSALNYRGIGNFDEAVNLLTTGPRIDGFTEDSLFGFGNEDLRNMLERSFGLPAVLDSRLLEIKRFDGFPIQCRDTDYGNNCVVRFQARWGGGYLILPDRDSYETVAMDLERVQRVEDLEHSFKLRAATDSGSGFSTVKVYEFVAEQPGHFDYLTDLPLSETEKMRAYFLGIIAHEAVHAMQAYAIDSTTSDLYRGIAKEELSTTLDHRFVTRYVDRHHDVYNSDEREVLNEDYSEAVRIFLTNSGFLKRYFPRRFTFIADYLPFVRENAIQEVVA